MIHSPLSPLTPTSPLYPDGIISPIWIRKHCDMIPSVFVLTSTLWEPPSSSISRKVMNENGIRIGSDEIDSKSGLDSRSSLFILSPVIESEIGSFVKTLKSEVFESALDYYREHSRQPGWIVCADFTSS
ncbi:hypothetical protein DFH28DRAFT_1125408 [Melampsora americana]|nr:hypothetical protein DFH28DRAFT_1125408 [Melampsora americana]